MDVSFRIEQEEDWQTPTDGWKLLHYGRGARLLGLMNPHNCIAAFLTHEARFPPLVAAKEIVIGNARIEDDASANGIAIKIAVEVHPLTTVAGPCLTPKDLSDTQVD